MSVSRKLLEAVNVAEELSRERDYLLWQDRLTSFLEAAIDSDTASRFLGYSQEMFITWQAAKEKQIGYLEGLAFKDNSIDEATEIVGKKDISGVTQSINPNDVFIVHGHDNEAKEVTARFIGRLGLSPIILHEKPNSGRTIIEKFEVYSDVGFAIVLLTPDDVGGEAENEGSLSGRARQNVILELGYFTGKLGRKNVCALYKDGVEIPSDFQGVLYTKLDDVGAWRQKVAQELVEAGFSIDLEGLLQS